MRSPDELPPEEFPHEEFPHGEIPADEASAEVLLARALDGDEEAWRQLYHSQEVHMRKAVSNRIPLRLRSSLDTEDLVQSTFLELTQHGAKLKITDARSLRAWLARVMVNKLRDRLRGRDSDAGRVLGSSQPPTEFMDGQPDVGPTHEELVQEAEFASRMYERMLALEGTDRDIVILRFMDRLPWTEIALRTGLAVSTVTIRYRELIDRMVRGFF